MIIFETDDSLMFFDGFGGGIVVENGLVVFLLDEAPVVLLKLGFLIG